MSMSILSEAPESTEEKEEYLSLTDSSSTESLVQVFRALAEKERDRMQAFKPTLLSLGNIVSKFHSAGIDNIDLELLDYDKLRKLNLSRKSPPDARWETSAEEVLYCVFNIDDAKFLVRVRPNNAADVYLRNVNLARQAVLYLDDKELWHEDSGFACDLSEEDGKLNLMNTLVSAAAARTVAKELSEACLPDDKSPGLGKRLSSFPMKKSP